MRQVDNFAIAAPDARMADIIMDLINNKLSIPIKWQGYLNMYNGVDTLQTKHYIRINIKIFHQKSVQKPHHDLDEHLVPYIELINYTIQSPMEWELIPEYWVNICPCVHLFVHLSVRLSVRLSPGITVGEC